MRASILDLRYKTKDVLKALERNESVTILYRGKEKGCIHPVEAAKSKTRKKVSDHSFFGSTANISDVESLVNQLRAERY